MEPDILIHVPRLCDSEMLELARSVQDLLKEIEESTLRCLREHGLEQHAIDLDAAASRTVNAMSALIESGDQPFWEALGIYVDEEGAPTAPEAGPG